VTKDAKDVNSGIPQGTVIGPASFLSFINDLPDNILSHIYLFADDTKLYNGVQNLDDCKQLQADVDELDIWSTKWFLRFNRTKCKIMSVGNSHVQYAYSMKDKDGIDINLERSVLERDLGVLVDEKFSFSDHIYKASCKANNVMAVIIRTYTDLDKDCFLLLYDHMLNMVLVCGLHTN